MFYDVYLALCRARGVGPTRAAVEIGLSKSTPSTWKKLSITPQAQQLQKIADYFGVTVDRLLSGEKKPAEGDITFSDFTYAFYGEAKALDDAEREMLLNMAKELARLKREREAKGQK